MKSFLFKELMLNQVKLGIKTITRRTTGLEEVNKDPKQWFVMANVSKGKKLIPGVLLHNKSIKAPLEKFVKPKYLPGDIIYCKENYHYDKAQDLVIYQTDVHPEYRKQIKWSSKLMMRAIYARTFVKCTGWKVERLFSISNQDAIAEGIERILYGGNVWYKQYDSNAPCHCLSANHSFITLFRSINGTELTDTNPWVFAYSFQLITEAEGKREAQKELELKLSKKNVKSKI